MKYSKDSSIAYCNVEFAKEIYGHKIPKKRYGYRLIGKKFVPLSLLDRIEDHLGCTTFDACSIFSAREMVGEAFWAELSIEEQDALPACLFQLIDEGRITFTFPE